MARGPWWPRKQSDQLLWMANFETKIVNYGAGSPLNLTIPQLTLAQNWVDAFGIMVEFADSVKSTMQAVTQWKDDGLNGDPKTAIVPAPVFAAAIVAPGNQGVVKQLFDLREQVVVNPGFSDAIGEDLGFLGAEITPGVQQDAQPSLKPTAEVNYGVRLAGSMQGYSQMRIEWRKTGTTVWQLVTFISNLPADAIVSPTTPGQPESGELRAIFFQKNQPVGVYSPNYPLTVSS